MDLFEYQARDLFEKHGVPVLAAAIATTADEAQVVATKIGGKVIVKITQLTPVKKRAQFLEWISKAMLLAQ